MLRWCGQAERQLCTTEHSGQSCGLATSRCRPCRPEGAADCQVAHSGCAPGSVARDFLLWRPAFKPAASFAPLFALVGAGGAASRRCSLASQPPSSPCLTSPCSGPSCCCTGEAARALPTACRLCAAAGGHYLRLLLVVAVLDWHARRAGPASVLLRVCSTPMVALVPPPQVHPLLCHDEAANHGGAPLACGSIILLLEMHRSSPVCRPSNPEPGKRSAARLCSAADLVPSGSPACST